MAVIEDGTRLLSVAAGMANERFADGARPSKVLMSQRQYDALCRWLDIDPEDVPRSMSVTDGKEYEDYIPIVICPDCDLYVV